MQVVVKCHQVLQFPVKVDSFLASINENNSKIAKKNLEHNYKKIVLYLKDLKDRGQINSVLKPKNKRMQTDLDKLVKIKKELKDSINKIKTIF